MRFQTFENAPDLPFLQSSICCTLNVAVATCPELYVGQKEECAHCWEVDQVTAFWFKCTSVYSVKARVRDICRGVSKSHAMVWPELKPDVLARAQNSIYWGRGPYPKRVLFYKYCGRSQKLLYMKNVGGVYGGLGCNTIKLQLAINRNW